MEKRDGVVYRSYSDPEARLEQLGRTDVEGVHWREQVKNPELFVAAYRAQFSEVEYLPGFYKSFIDEWRLKGESRRHLVHLLDMMFAQLKLADVKVYVPPPKARDPLGFDGPVDGSDWSGMSKEYYLQGTLERRVCLYRNYMIGATSSFMMDPIYDDCLLHYRAMEVRVAEMMSIIRDIPDSYELVFPGDGVGVGSIASVVLERRYVSAEPNRIGELANFLGLISSRMEGAIEPKKDQAQVLILSNLSRFVDLECLMRGYRNIIVYDATRVLMEGFSSVSSDFTLSTTMLDYRPKTLALQREYQRSYESMRIPKMTSSDPVVIQSLILNQKHDPLSKYRAVANMRDVVDGSEFVLSERRLARDPPRKEGAFSYENGMLNYYDYRTHKVFQEDGFYTKKSSAYQSTTTLSNDYDIMGLLTFRVILHFSCWHLDSAYSEQALVQIILVYMVRDGPEEWEAVYRVVTPNLSNEMAREFDFNRAQEYRKVALVLREQAYRGRVKEFNRQRKSKAPDKTVREGRDDLPKPRVRKSPQIQKIDRQICQLRKRTVRKVRVTKEPEVDNQYQAFNERLRDIL